MVSPQGRMPTSALGSGQEKRANVGIGPYGGRIQKWIESE